MRADRLNHMQEKSRHLSLLCGISELAALLSDSENISVFLQKAVELVGSHLSAEVSSIYLLDESTQKLVLEATRGLNQDAVGKIYLGIGEGLVGRTLEQLKPLNVGAADRHPGFKYFAAAGEDRFNSFLAVPILRGEEKIGVLVVQHSVRDYFGETDVLALRAIASQLAGAIGNARMVSSHPRLLEQPDRSLAIQETIDHTRGEVASPGYAVAFASVYDRRHEGRIPRRIDHESGHALGDFRKAVQATAEQIEDLQYRFSHRLPESVSLIFTAHIMILKDGRFAGEMEKLIKAGTPPAVAIDQVTQHWVDLYSLSPYPYIREKISDIRDLSERLLKNLAHDSGKDPYFSENQIVIASELFPSDILKLASEDVKGIVLVGGGPVAHVAILARSLQIPMIITDRPEFLQLREGTPVVLDAQSGEIYVQPPEDIIRDYESLAHAWQSSETAVREVAATTYTRDGTRIRLLANVNLLNDLILAREMNAEGIGLYRSEFPFLLRSALPSEEEQ